MSNPYLPPTRANVQNPTGQRFLSSTRAEDYQPAGNQFTLRGLFILMTATCVILAILALVIHEPRDWIGALVVPFICSMIIVAMEIFRKLFPPKAHFPMHLPLIPHNPLQMAYFGEGESPFSRSDNYFGDKGGNSPFPPAPPPPLPNEQAPREQTG